MAREFVDELIARIMRLHPGDSPAAMSRYFEAVHQDLAPLARDLERENIELRNRCDELARQKFTKRSIE